MLSFRAVRCMISLSAIVFERCGVSDYVLLVGIMASLVRGACAGLSMFNASASLLSFHASARLCVGGSNTP